MQAMRNKLKKKYLIVVVLAVSLLIAGIAIAGIASYSLSLNSPAAFPIDI